MPLQTGSHSASTLFRLLSRALLVRRWRILRSCLRRPTNGSDTGALPCTTRDPCCCQPWGPKGCSCHSSFTDTSFTTAITSVTTITAYLQRRHCSLGSPSGSTTAEPTSCATLSAPVRIGCCRLSVTLSHTCTGLVLMGRPHGLRV